MSVTALAWTLRNPVVTTALVGVSGVGQLKENLRAADAAEFTSEELAAIDEALS